ncbi:tyrosine-type recombinase/integrase [Novosphingobium flavum]|nr:tyrosine-type recombinase/integrase [Novosphingobium aerophilum]
MSLKDSALDAEVTKARESSAKATVTQSKTFRDGVIYLYQRSDFKKPTWMCRVKVPGGKGYVNRSTGTGDEHKAFKFADDLYNQLLVKSLTGEAPVGKRIGPVIDAYVKRLEPQKDRLSIHYKILLMKRVKPFLDRKTFEELTTSTLSKLVDDQAGKTKKGSLSPNSVKRMFSDLKHFFNWCVEEGHLAAMPKFPKINGDQKRRPHFNREEWNQLLRAVPDYLKESPGSVQRDRRLMLHYVLILAETGIRVGEARNLRWRDIRPINNSKDPNVPNVALTVKGKTGIREVVASGPLVRQALYRILEMRRKDLKDESSDIHKKDDVPPDSFVFCDKHGTAIESFKKSFAAFIEHAGLTFDTFGQRRTIYSLRHTYATTRIEAGVNHYALAQNMGTSVAMLEQYYGHTTNVGMVEELTKPKTKRVAKASEEGGSALGWLGSRK